MSDWGYDDYNEFESGRGYNRKNDRDNRHSTNDYNGRRSGELNGIQKFGGESIRGRGNRGMRGGSIVAGIVRARGGRGGSGRDFNDRSNENESNIGRGSYNRGAGNRNETFQSNDFRKTERRGSFSRSDRGRCGNSSFGGVSSYLNTKEEKSEEQERPREFYIPPDPTNDESEIFNSGISSGINFSKYDDIPVQSLGENVPSPIKKFEDAGFRNIIVDNIRKSGYKIPTPIQKAAIPIISKGRDLMACAQTGSGKTAAFLLPILNNLIVNANELSPRRPHAIIVSPTRELAIQIYHEARKFALGSFLKLNVIYGGTSSKHQGENAGKANHILICTPGRLLDFVEKGLVDFGDLRVLVLDEADRMLDMGFKDSVNSIMNHETIRPSKNRQVLMFSATFQPEIQRLALEYLSNYVFLKIGLVGGACSDVSQKIYEVKKFQKRNKLLEILQENSEGTIVFVETKRGADFLASLLSESEFPTTSIHGDRLQSQREEALSDFKSGKMKVLIATSVAARGLDIKNVKHVVNYDMPGSIDEYVHRIGRTGRLGNCGQATSFYDPERDFAIAKDLIKILEDADQKVPKFLQNSGERKLGGRNSCGNRKHFDDNYTPASKVFENEEYWD